MSSTSIGTGSALDANENRPLASDPWPSRTLGADAPAADARRAQTPPAHEGQSAAAVDESLLPPGLIPSPEQVDTAFPEGPNVAPSPWEEEAARGRG